MADGMIIIIDFFKKTETFEILDNLFAAGKTIETAITAGSCIHNALVIHDLEMRQGMALADFVVVAIMGRRDLQGAGTELPVDMVVEHHRDDPVGQRQPDAHSGQVRIALIFGMHGNSGIAEHRFRSGSGDHDKAGAVGIGISYMVKLALEYLHAPPHRRPEQCGSADTS